MHDILPNMGRDPSVVEPPGIDHLYPDRDIPRPVMLVVWDMDKPDLPPKSRHWAIAWQVGTATNGHPVHRQLAIVREHNAHGPLSHLTNWGPKTKTVEPGLRCIPLAELALPQRRWLEGVAGAEPVRKPNGRWNCQDWVLSVFAQAVRAGVLARAQVESALAEAGCLEPLPLGS